MTTEQNIDFLKRRGFAEQKRDDNTVLVKRIPLGGDANVDVEIVFGTCYGISCDLWLLDSVHSVHRIWIGADTGSSFTIPAGSDVKELLKTASEQIKTFGKLFNAAAKMVSRKA